MADKKISALTAAATPLAGTEVLPIVQSGATVKVSIADVTAGRDMSANSVSANGNITLSGASRKITADFSNATHASRALFQTSAANSASVVGNIPTGTGGYAEYRVYNSSDPDNASTLDISVSGGRARVRSDRTGTGAFLPLSFAVGGLIRLDITPAGNVAVGVGSLATTDTNGFPYIPTCAGVPTGTPTAIAGFAPMVADSTNNRLYVYLGGAWRAMN